MAEKPLSGLVERPYLLAIDPGLSGALCVYNLNTKAPEAIYDMPLRLIKTGKKELDATALVFIVERYALVTAFAVIEKVSAMPRQGVVSTFRFGEVFGLTKAILHASFIPTKQVPASVWKSDLNLSRNKQESLDLAKKLYPNHVHYFTEKEHDGRAESLLLAHFVAKRFK